MSIINGISDFFGLDIGTSSIRLVQLGTSSHGDLRPLISYASEPIDTKSSLSDSPGDQQKTLQVIKKLVEESDVSTKNVVVGLPSTKVFMTVIDTERLSEAELAKSLKYQADSIIPTPPDESKLDWVLLGDSPVDNAKVEVLVTSVSNPYVEKRLDMLESIGLKVIAFEPDSLAMLRALIPPGTTAPTMVLRVSSLSTDLAVIMNGTPKLIRSIPTGTAAIVKAAAQNLNITEEQAHQFVFKFGLTKSKLEGQVRGAIESTINLLESEIEKSIKFFETRYHGQRPERVIVTGTAAILPGFAQDIADRFKLNVEIGNAWRNIAFPAEQQDELLGVSSIFSVASGLAQRNI